jgi:glutamine synthetase
LSLKLKGKMTMTTTNDILKAIKDDRIDFVDLRFTDLKGKLQHVTSPSVRTSTHVPALLSGKLTQRGPMSVDGFVVDERVFLEGVMFDGSSIAGWKAINESDMVLLPAPTMLHRDPFFDEPT